MPTDNARFFPFTNCLCNPNLLSQCKLQCRRGTATKLEMVCPYLVPPTMRAMRSLRWMFPGATDPSELVEELVVEFMMETPALNQLRELQVETLSAYLREAVRNWLRERQRRRHAAAPRGEAWACRASFPDGRGKVHCRVHAITLDRVAPCKAHGPNGSGPCPHFSYKPPVELAQAPEGDPEWLDRNSVGVSTQIEPAIIERDEHRELRRRVELLEEDERRVIEGHFAEDPKSLKALAEELQTSVSQVQKILARALRKLKAG